jgi:hypothetical protein
MMLVFIGVCVHICATYAYLLTLRERIASPRMQIVSSQWDVPYNLSIKSQNTQHWLKESLVVHGWAIERYCREGRCCQRRHMCFCGHFETILCFLLSSHFFLRNISRRERREAFMTSAYWALEIRWRAVITIKQITYLHRALKSTSLFDEIAVCACQTTEPVNHRELLSQQSTRIDDADVHGAAQHVALVFKLNPGRDVSLGEKAQECTSVFQAGWKYLFQLVFIECLLAIKVISVSLPGRRWLQTLCSAWETSSWNFSTQISGKSFCAMSTEILQIEIAF